MTSSRPTRHKKSNRWLGVPGILHAQSEQPDWCMHQVDEMILGLNLWKAMVVVSCISSIIVHYGSCS